MDSKDEIDAFKDNLRLGKSTILDWKKFSDNIRYHIGGKDGVVASLLITAGPEYAIGERARSITLDYDVSQIVNITKIGSRTTRYSLLEDKLGFELSEVRQIILGSNVELSVALPAGAAVVKSQGTPQIGPQPYSFEAKANIVAWSGPMTGKWMLVYEIEEPLSNEIYEFFSNAYKQAVSLVPVAFLAASVLLLLTLLFKMRRP